MEFHQAQEQIAIDPHRFRVAVCGRKFGKTTLNAEELKCNAICADDRRVLYMAETLGESRQLMWDRLLKIMAAAIVKVNDTRLEMKVRTQFGGTSDIFIGSWEKVEIYRGDEFNFILPDEVQKYRNFWVGWNEALRPTLTPRLGAALFTGTPKGFNHLYDLFNLEYTDQDFKSFRFPTSANPHISPDEIEKAKQQLSEDEFAQEYLAEFRKSSGLVFKDFDRTKHIFDYELHDSTEYLAGVDWGTRAYAAIPFVKVKDGVYYVTREFYKTGCTDAEVADFVAAQRFNKVYPDPESASGVLELKKRGVNTRDVNKGKDSIIHGISKMTELFRENRLFIHKSCTNLISELEMYSYLDERPDHNPNENPQDKYNHAIDALRYVVSTHVISKPFIPRPFHDKNIEIWQGR